MPALDALKGASLRGIWVDAPGHYVTITLRTMSVGTALDYNIVLEGVTNFSFYDENPAPWPGAEVTEIRSQHDPDSMHLDFSFGSDTAGIVVTCAKLVMHRARPAG
ncbi:hypothetical protein [Allosalinactinospora lopnorensis]|uniref:hypothetical protein n=1 Tax=Allosalinactinospora lopnorensis TaxID=1352348 RepID=UPI000623C167|nr:hypothetical protein [Allosalinactinospora lopnorensis]